MEVTVQREWFTDQSVCGNLLLDGVYFCYTLEPPNRLEKPRCIPPGTYKARKQDSPHFGVKTIWLQDVPGFTDIEVHPGSWPHDTKGCTIVGYIHWDNFVGHSWLAFDDLMKKLPDEFNITYIGGQPEVNLHGGEVSVT